MERKKKNIKEKNEILEPYQDSLIMTLSEPLKRTWWDKFTNINKGYQRGQRKSHGLPKDSGFISSSYF
jgi:hypothetical protein